ncbi:MAG: alpha-L-fucosidase [Candidatus Acidiferrales bacterium]
MKLTRRQALKLLGSAAPALALRSSLARAQATNNLSITPGPFSGTRDSLAAYQIPAWYKDAKFGIWAHWGPQSGIEDGDWYARNMYVQGSDQYEYGAETFGHPSKVGYKDLIPTFKAAKWDPEHLMDLYVKAGAKYFVSMGVHHDNFDMWDSKYHERWNAVATGPHKDIVGMWAKAARARGLRFGVSEHLSNSFDWFAPAHGSDATGDFAGVPYDGSDPAFADLYHSYADMPADFAKTAMAMGRIAPDSWKQEYFNRIKDLTDQHHPDLLYTDGGIPFEEYGLALVANVYNLSAQMHGGNVEAVYNSKTITDCTTGVCALDRERGVSDDIWPTTWQTDTCIGNWHYKRGVHYKTGKKVVDLLVDIVSKNGNLLLNFPLPNSGELDVEEMQTLNDLTKWMTVNSEGIYSSRPWKIFGEGPGTKIAPPPPGGPGGGGGGGGFGGAGGARPAGQGVPPGGGGPGMASGTNRGRFNENQVPELTSADVRFTTKGSLLYAFVQGWPDNNAAVVQSLGTTSPQMPGKITNVRMLGYDGNLQFTQDEKGLTVTLPGSKPASADIGVTLKITGA